MSKYTENTEVERSDFKESIEFVETEGYFVHTRKNGVSVFAPEALYPPIQIFDIRNSKNIK